MKIIEKDILTVEKGIIFQQVNCKMIQGSGLALAIRNKWPKAYEEYITFSKKYKNDFERLGLWQYINVEPYLAVCNIFGQLNFGSKDRDTDYAALHNVFCDLQDDREDYYYFPYLMSCDRAKGDWNIVSKMIEFYFPNAVICKLV